MIGILLFIAFVMGTTSEPRMSFSELMATELTRPTTTRTTTAPTNVRPYLMGKDPMLTYIFDAYEVQNQHYHDKSRPPTFVASTWQDETVLNANTASNIKLSCGLTHGKMNGLTVSWIRLIDGGSLEIITLDKEIHTTDSRFRVDRERNTWRLTMSDVKASDSGIYCCHVSTYPPLLKRYQIIVHKPEILLPKETFLEINETLSLRCVILNLDTNKKTTRIHWYRGNNTIPIHEKRGSVTIDTNLVNLTTKLQLAHLTAEDAGNYTCAIEAPIEMRAVTRVHVLKGSSLAELQGGVQAMTNNLLLTMILAVFSINHDLA